MRMLAKVIEHYCRALARGRKVSPEIVEALECVTRELGEMRRKM